MKKPPGKKYIEGRFKLDHKEYGELELDIALDQENVIVIAMRKLLNTKFLRVKLWGNALSAELAPGSKVRVKGIRRLRGTRKEK
jgi:hypothetical protein